MAKSPQPRNFISNIYMRGLERAVKYGPRFRPERKSLESKVNSAQKNRDSDADSSDSKAGPSFTQAEKLIGITEEAHEVLMSADSTFPFMLFPDTIIVDRQKLTIIHRTFFSVANVVSVQIADILNVEVNVGPFFGSVRIASRYFVDNHQEINYLKREEAVKIQRIIQGYMIAHHRGIDASAIDKEQLLILLNDLGQEAVEG